LYDKYMDGKIAKFTNLKIWRRNNHMKILGCFAHLDDAEIWAGGTILKHVSRGDYVETAVFVTSGEKRIEESLRAHKILGAKLTLYEYDKRKSKSDFVEIIADYIMKLQPDVILTHWYSDCHPEHRDTFDLVSRAIIKPWIEISKPLKLYAVDTYGSQGLIDGFSPTHYIDITSQWHQKMNAIKEFKSQPYEIWQNMVTKQNSLFGERVKVKFAEGFLQIPIQGKLIPTDYLL
jgi:N-acetylglucosamine malate deacetylase 1